MSICVGLSLNFTPHLQPLPGVLLLAGRVLTLTPHSQVHTWISAGSVAERRWWNSLPRLHPVPLPLIIVFSSTCPYILHILTDSLFYFLAVRASLPHFTVQFFTVHPHVSVLLPQPQQFFFFFFWLSSAFLIWEERGGIRPEKGKGRGEERRGERLSQQICTCELTETQVRWCGELSEQNEGKNEEEQVRQTAVREGGWSINEERNGWIISDEHCKFELIILLMREQLGQMDGEREVDPQLIQHKGYFLSIIHNP